MKKALAIFTAITLAACVQAATINWGSQNTSSLVLGNSGSAATVGWACQLVYLGADGVVGGVGANEDVLASTTSPTQSIGKDKNTTAGYILPPNPNTYMFGTTYTTGDKFVIRVYDNSIPANASAYLNIYQSGTTPFAIAAVNGTGIDNFYFTGNVGGVATWTPIPEPTSMALFGIGMGMLALRRRFQKKA